MCDSLPWTPVNSPAKFDAASFILAGEIRNRTNTHTQTVTDISTPCLSACVDNNTDSINFAETSSSSLNEKCYMFVNFCVLLFDPFAPLCENMTSSSKPEVQVRNVLQCCQRMTVPWPQ